MIYTTKELLEMGETEYSIRNKVYSKQLFLIERGLYSDEKEWNLDEGYISKKYPNSIITGISALHIYDLIDFIPDKFYLASEQHSFPIRRKDVLQSYQEEKYFSIGKTIIKYSNSYISIYNLERMLIELVRLKEKFPPEIFYEAVVSYRRIKNKLDFYKISEYLKVFSNGNSLLSKIKELI